MTSKVLYDLSHVLISCYFSILYLLFIKIPYIFLQFPSRPLQESVYTVPGHACFMSHGDKNMV